MTRLKQLTNVLIAAIVAIAAVVESPAVAAQPAQPAQSAQPNIVFIISDDQNFEHLGFMGSKVAQTPHVDRLAAAGTVFSTGYLPMSVCRPTLATFMSGQLPHQSGVYTNYLQNHRIGHDTKHIDPQTSIGNHLKRAGYATFATGKLWEGDPREQGFTHGTVDISFGGFLKFVRSGQDELFGFIDAHANRQPMFIWWAPLLPHLPHNPPQKYLDLYPPDKVPVPDYVEPDRRAGFVDDERKLLAMTTWFDDGVGELVAKLKAAGAYDNTLFVFVIDNGWANGLPSKHSVGEKSLRTPMFFTWPGRVPAGRRVDAVTDTMDLYPTMLSYAGAPIPDGAAGRDLRPVIEQKQPPRDEAVIGAIYPHYARFKGAHPEKDVLALYRRDARWKFVWYVRDFTVDTAGIPGGAQHMLREDFVAHDAGDIDLFDLDADPYEQRDLADAPRHAERLAAFKRDVLDWWTRTGGEPIPDAHAARHPASDGADRPNIVLILADDLGYGDLGCYGATKIDTPNIDRLAREGRRFTDAHSPSSVCTPTRYNLMTGRYCWRSWAGSSGVWSNDPLIFDPAERMTIASLLKRARYDTAMVGKWHLGFGRPDGDHWDPLLGVDYNKVIKPGPIECGFDTWFGIPHVGQLPHVYIRDHHVVGLDKLDKPIRLVLDPKKPQYATTYDKRPRDAGMSPWLTFENTEPIQYEHEDLAIRLTQEAVAYLDTRSPDAARPYFLYFAHRNPHVPWRPNPRFKGQSAAGNYGDFIGELDWSVGQVLDALDKRGLTDNTLVILSSDNGGMAQYAHLERAVRNGHALNGPLRGQKTQAYEGGHRVPLLARWPGRIKPGTTSDALIALTDVMATFAELTSQTLPNDAGEDSFSFLPHLLDRDPTGPVRESLVHDSYRGVFAIRRGPWKLILHQTGGGIREDIDTVDPDKPAGQLFNLADDLSESNNLYAQRSDRVADLTALLDGIKRDGRSRPTLNDTK